MAKVQLIMVEAKRGRHELEAVADKLILLQENQKAAAATAAREGNAISRNSLCSLGKDEKSPNSSKCCSDFYCIADYYPEDGEQSLKSCSVAGNFDLIHLLLVLYKKPLVVVGVYASQPCL